MNALYRPGPLEYIPTLLHASMAGEPITYDVPIRSPEGYLRHHRIPGAGDVVVRETRLVLRKARRIVPRGDKRKRKLTWM